MKPFQYVVCWKKNRVLNLPWLFLHMKVRSDYYICISKHHSYFFKNKRYTTYMYLKVIDTLSREATVLNYCLVPFYKEIYYKRWANFFPLIVDPFSEGTSHFVRFVYRITMVENLSATSGPHGPMALCLRKKKYHLTYLCLMDSSGLFLIEGITKTRLFKYIEHLSTKKGKFSNKTFWYFSCSCSKHRLWVLVRTASARRF